MLQLISVLGVTTILKGSVALAPAWITSRYGISLAALRRMLRKLLRMKRKQSLLHY
jgi:hypothetical protein